MQHANTASLLERKISCKTHLSASSTCKGTFSAPSGGSLAKRYELLGLGEETYLGPAGSSGDTFSSVSAAPPEEHLDDGRESEAPAIMGYVGDAEWLLLLLLPLPPLSCPSWLSAGVCVWISTVRKGSTPDRTSTTGALRPSCTCSIPCNRKPLFRHKFLYYTQLKTNDDQLQLQPLPQLWSAKV